MNMLHTVPLRYVFLDRNNNTKLCTTFKQFVTNPTQPQILPPPLLPSKRGNKNVMGPRRGWGYPRQLYFQHFQGLQKQTNIEFKHI